ncbi:hypothetical protein BXU11_06240 [Flavobacterium sp. LM5]|uniref:potassium channel family protein n=1 Tax=Flavobacterium sp. LM5 TaxID=1938610 RepID=UPI000993384F|nr:potassium channel family protein [Flavobacterium sp. LM5]OOV29482.1 hypothetical protein BXU11_06240 [Flavobacterium sp. LM5]
MIQLKILKKKIIIFHSNHSYEILLIALLFHLYGSVFFTDLHFYGTYVRIINTIILYFASTNSFFQRKNKISQTNKIIIFTTLFLNLSLLLFDGNQVLKVIREFSYLIFLSLILYNTAVFLFSPHRLDKALISASISGYLLIIEIAVRTFMIFYQSNKNHILSNIDFSYHTNTFIDTVYFCTVTITSIGYGDVLPISHNAKMATSLLGLTGQFYLVIIMGIMVSKFISKEK